MRVRSCACGFTGKTWERWDKVYRQAAGKQPASAPQDLGKQRDLRVSGSDLSSSDPLSNPDPTSVVSKQGERRKGRKNGHDYDPEFLALWDGITPPPRGMKFKAFRAWIKCKPDTTLTQAAFHLWRQTDGWRRGYEPHLSTWLNDRGWEKEPTDAEMRGTTTGSRSEKTMDNLRDWEPPTRKAAT
jgi:hypothetical protein